MRPSHYTTLALFVAFVAGCYNDPSLAQRAQSSFIDFGNFIAACHAGNPAARLHRREYLDYGCYCGLGGKGTPVDATDECCQAHDACWAKVKKDTGVSCFGENYHNNFNDPATGTPTTDCSKWTFAESCSKAKHPTNNKPEEEACCNCDLVATQCFQRARGTYNAGYVDWSDGDDPGETCGPNKGKLYKCQSGYIKRGEPCLEGTKRGNRAIGYWCETTCRKPQICQTSSAVGNAYARCAAPPAEDETCAATLLHSPVTALAYETTCTGSECDECPNCTGDTCTGNHAPPDDTSDDEWPIEDDPWDDDVSTMPDAGVDATADDGGFGDGSATPATYDVP